MPWKHPTRTKQLNGIGINKSCNQLTLLSNYSNEIRNNKEYIESLIKCCIPNTENFERIPDPDEDDWLGCRNPKDQSFSRYVTGRGRRISPSSKRKIIYLLPIAESISKENIDKFPPFEALQSMVASFFCVETIIMHPVTFDSFDHLKEISTRKCHEEGERWKQYHAGHILKCLKKIRPKDAFTLCAFTMNDLYKNSFNYLFGLASPSGVGVFSFFRQDASCVACELYTGHDDPKSLLRRASATLCHEIGHTFGLTHCTYFKCLMQGAMCLVEAESRGHQLCPVCMRKLTWSINKHPIERYNALFKHFCKYPEVYMDPLTWVLNRAEVVGFKLTSNVDTDDNNNNNNQKKKAVVFDNDNNNEAIIQIKKVTAKTRLIVREEANKTSKLVREIAKGEEVSILYPVDIKRTKSGSVRVPLCTSGEWITAVTKTGKNLITNVNDVLKESKKDLQQKGTKSNQFAPQLKRHLSDEGKKLVAKALHNTSRWK